MTAHLTIRNSRFVWSGYNASGDPSHAQALVAEVGRHFILTGDGTLYLIGPGQMRFAEFSPEAFVIAARSGMFGFRVLLDDERTARRRDREDRRRHKLGCRGRIAEDHRAGKTPDRVAHDDEPCYRSKMDRGAPGSAGGRATFERHGRDHMKAIGARGFQAFTDRYFAGDRQQATEWLRLRAHEKRLDGFVDKELARRLDQGQEIASMELPILSDPDEDGIPF